MADLRSVFREPSLSAGERVRCEPAVAPRSSAVREPMMLRSHGDVCDEIAAVHLRHGGGGRYEPPTYNAMALTALAPGTEGGDARMCPHWDIDGIRCRHWRDAERALVIVVAAIWSVLDRLDGEYRLYVNHSCDWRLGRDWLERRDGGAAGRASFHAVARPVDGGRLVDGPEARLLAEAVAHEIDRLVAPPLGPLLLGAPPEFAGSAVDMCVYRDRATIRMLLCASFAKAVGDVLNEELALPEVQELARVHWLRLTYPVDGALVRPEGWGRSAGAYTGKAAVPLDLARARCLDDLPRTIRLHSACPLESELAVALLASWPDAPLHPAWVLHRLSPPEFGSDWSAAPAMAIAPRSGPRARAISSGGRAVHAGDHRARAAALAVMQVCCAHVTAARVVGGWTCAWDEKRGTPRHELRIEAVSDTRCGFRDGGRGPHATQRVVVYLVFHGPLDPICVHQVCFGCILEGQPGRETRVVPTKAEPQARHLFSLRLSGGDLS